MVSGLRGEWEGDECAGFDMVCNGSAWVGAWAASGACSDRLG